MRLVTLAIALFVLSFSAAFAQPVGPGVAQIVAAIQAGQVTLGQTTMSASYPVAIANNQTAIPTNQTQVNGVATPTGAGTVSTTAPRFAVGQDVTTVAGSAPGTAGAASTNVFSMQGIASMVPILTNPGTAANWAIAATGAVVPANALLSGVRAQNAEATPVTNGQLVAGAADLVGKAIVMPYANKENFVSGTTAAITTATNTQVIAAQAAGVKIYMTEFSCSNTGATTSSIDFTSGSGGTEMWNTMVPAGGGSNLALPAPVPTAAAAALYVTTGAASTSIKCSVGGYIGS